MEIIKKSIAIILSVSILISSTSSWSQPLRYEEDFIDNELEATTTWDPVPVDAFVGDLKLKVWILKYLVPAPKAGYFIEKSDWIDIKRMLDSLDKEISRVKLKEREICDKSLKEKDIFCQDLNKELIQKIDNQKTSLKLKDESIDSLKSEIFWIKTAAGVIILGLGTLSVYQTVK